MKKFDSTSFRMDAYGGCSDKVHKSHPFASVLICFTPFRSLRSLITHLNFTFNIMDKHPSAWRRGHKKNWTLGRCFPSPALVSSGIPALQVTRNFSWCIYAV